MKKIDKRLYSKEFQVGALAAVLMLILTARLFSLTVWEKGTWTKAAENLSVKTIYTSAPRGQILDRKGRVLAGNAYTRSVQMNRGDMTNEVTNRTIEGLVALLEKNGDEMYDRFPIQIRGRDAFYYEEGADTEDFLKTFGIAEPLNPEEAFQKIRSFFRINPNLSAAEARKIMVIRNELFALGYKKYMPITVAEDISDESVVELEENQARFPGVEVRTEVAREYPEGQTAAHLLGYMGKINREEKGKYTEEKGYRAETLVGKEGLERAYETVLKGKDGEKKVQVDASGNFIRMIEEKSAEKGKDITLSVDLSLQKTAEEALEKALKTMRVGGTFTSKYGNSQMTKAPKGEVGAVVALEVGSGDVLAMASYPAFDPNLFVHGISPEDWESLQSENARDPLAPAPLYNVATRSAVQPGSTFKMVTATAALQCGLNPEERLYDDGYIQFPGETFGCLLWNRFHRKHGYLNLQEAMEVSCNYYFFDIATGNDFYQGRSLGYKKKITIDTITDYAKQYGLGQATGIEIPETEMGVPTKAKKIKALKTALENDLFIRGETYFTEATVRNRKELSRSIEKISSWISEKLTKGELEKRLAAAELGVKKEQVSALSDLCKYTYFNQATWNVGDALNLSIGQGENAYTPLQMAGYIATLGNHGVKNQISMVEKIEDRGTIVKRPSTKVKVDRDTYFAEIIRGMVRVANSSEGSLAGIFSGFPVTVAGKSGTAERDGYDNFAWVVTLAPAEDPKIAVAVMIVQGGTAANAGPVAKEVLGKFFDLHEKEKGGEK